MTSNSVYETFRRDNERRKNELIAKILNFAILVGPLLIIANLCGAFPNLSYKKLIAVTIADIVITIWAQIFIRLAPYSRKIKYVLFLASEVIIFFISIDKNFGMFISYALVPLVSCIYFNKRFSYIMTSICYVAMIASIWYRAFFVAAYYPGVESAFQWGIGYTFGLTLEYFLVSVFVHAVNKKYCSVIDENLEAITVLQKTQETLTSSYSKLLVKKHEGIQEHLEKSCFYVKLLCEELKHEPMYTRLMDDVFISALSAAASLHDIGLIAIPDTILEKHTPLTPHEQKAYQKHTEYGEKLIRDNLYPIENREFLKIARDIALYHHEWWNGSGYPLGLVGKSIPLSARIMAAANVLERLTRSDAEPSSSFTPKIIEQIKMLSGTELDPAIASVIKRRFNSKKS